jgi:TatA/E family protein of Tat protein translocase
VMKICMLRCFCLSADWNQKEVRMIGGLQPTHILIIIVVAILFIAPSRLPELVRGIGKAFGEFKAGLKEAHEPTPPPSDPEVKK